MPLATLLVLLGASAAPATSESPAPEAALAAARALVAQVAPRVEQIRGLAFKRPVKVEIAGAAQVRAHFEQRLAPPSSEAQLRAQEAAYVQLGLLPPGGTLAAGLVDTLEDQARGYYDPGSDTFYLTEGSAEATAGAVVAHELTHALDDQYYDIEALIGRAHDDDQSMALSAVLEGSGTIVMAVYLAQEIAAGRLPADIRQRIQASETPAATRLRAAAPFFQRSLTAPYLLGLTFLLRGDPGRMRSALDMKDVDHALREPPLSTEQVLHPEKYWDPAARDLPRDVPLPDLSAQLGRGFTLAGSGRLGELLLGVLVGAPTPDATQGLDPALWDAPAAAGLQGDLWQHYSDGARSATLLATLWDSPADALEFVAALRPTARRRAYRYGASVLLIGGDLEERADALAPVAMSALQGDARGKDAR